MTTPNETPSTLAVWLMAVRPRTLPVSVAPVVVGTAVAWADGVFRVAPALAALAGALLLQIASNLANDLFDHEKGADTDERVKHNFGMAQPEGYRKAIRLMRMAERFRLPVISLVDTAGAHPGVGAEERGQAEAIARNLREMAALKVPVIVTVSGEGGSGGALAIAVGNRVLMMQYSVYAVISPEGCAAILWSDGTRGPEAAEALKLTAADINALGCVIDEVIPEPLGGAHTDHLQMAGNVKQVLKKHLAELQQLPPEELVEQRYQKFRAMTRVQE